MLNAIRCRFRGRLMAAAELAGRDWSSPPRTTAFGALLSHITGDAEAATFQPMNVNFGLFPPLHDVGKKVRKEAAVPFPRFERLPLRAQQLAVGFCNVLQLKKLILLNNETLVVQQERCKL